MGANVTNRITVDTSKTYVPASGASTVTDVTNLPFSLGTVVQNKDGTKRYKLVLVEDKALVSGDLVCYTTDDNGYEVTSDRAGGTSDNAQPAGLALGAVTDGNVCWIQTYGLNDVVALSDDSVAAGEDVIPHATADGEGDSYVPGTSHPSTSFGHCIVNDETAGIPVGGLFLDCPKG